MDAILNFRMGVVHVPMSNSSSPAHSPTPSDPLAISLAALDRKVGEAHDLWNRAVADRKQALKDFEAAYETMDDTEASHSETRRLDYRYAVAKKAVDYATDYRGVVLSEAAAMNQYAASLLEYSRCVADESRPAQRTRCLAVTEATGLLRAAAKNYSDAVAQRNKCFTAWFHASKQKPRTKPVKELTDHATNMEKTWEVYRELKGAADRQQDWYQRNLPPLADVV